MKIKEIVSFLESQAHLSLQEQYDNAGLIAGANIVTISATNISGNDSKSETIIYSQPVATPAPIVSITVPNTNPFNTSINIVAITATVLNVTSASQMNCDSPGGGDDFSIQTQHIDAWRGWRCRTCRDDAEHSMTARTVTVDAQTDIMMTSYWRIAAGKKLSFRFN